MYLDELRLDQHFIQTLLFCYFVFQLNERLRTLEECEVLP